MTTMSTSVRTSQAMVFVGAGQPLQAQTFPLRAPLAGEVRVRIRCCTICGSDLHTYQGRRSTPTPTILGHEILGDVDMLGAGEPVCDHEGRAVKVGDRVTWSIAASCHTCFYCTHDLPQKCEKLVKYGHEAIDSHHALLGGLAEYCILTPGTTIVRVPPEVPDLVACPANCATATVAAALRIAGIKPGHTILIQGLGTLGLTAAAMARSAGAQCVIGCDLDQQRLALSPRFGVSHPVLVGKDTQLKALVDRLTNGRGVDAAIELSGATAAMNGTLPLLRIGGKYVLVGAVFPSPDVNFSPETIIRRMLTITGLHNYSPDDLLAAVRFLGRYHQTYPFLDLVEGVWPLREADAAFKHAIEHRCLRVAVRD
ncbi:MAG: zinc-binding dehydrogenase [Phycisphaeraceae bacterium]|nr:zinc-binding dehydrogenase [Phycisphaeraceae bacterium]